MKPINPKSQLFKFLTEYSDYSDYNRPQTTCQLIRGLVHSFGVFTVLAAISIFFTLYSLIGVAALVWFNYFYLGGVPVIEVGNGFFGIGALIFIIEMMLVVISVVGVLWHRYKISDKLSNTFTSTDEIEHPLVIQWLSDLYNKVCTKVVYTDTVTPNESDDSFKP